MTSTLPRLALKSAVIRNDPETIETAHTKVPAQQAPRRDNVQGDRYSDGEERQYRSSARPE